MNPAISSSPHVVAAFSSGASCAKAATGPGTSTVAALATASVLVSASASVLASARRSASINGLVSTASGTPSSATPSRMTGSTGLCTTACPGDAPTGKTPPDDVGVTGPPPGVCGANTAGSPPSTLTTLPRLFVRSISVPSLDEPRARLPRGLLPRLPPAALAAPPLADDEPDEPIETIDPELEDPPGPWW